MSVRKRKKGSANKVSSINRFRDILKDRNCAGAVGKNLNKYKFWKKIMISISKASAEGAKLCFGLGERTEGMRSVFLNNG